MRLVHRQHQVRLADPPLGLGEFQRLGRLRSVALGHAAVDPGFDQVALLARERGIVREMAELLIGIPGRHPPVANDFGQHFALGLGFVVAHQTERRRGSFVVAVLAALLQDRFDVLVEGDGDGRTWAPARR